MAIQAGNMFTWDWSKLTAYVRTVIGPTGNMTPCDWSN